MRSEQVAAVGEQRHGGGYEERDRPFNRLGCNLAGCGGSVQAPNELATRDVGLEDRFATLLPEVVLSVGPEQLAMIAARAMIPRPPPAVGVGHLHAPQVSVREQASIVVARLREHGQASFRELVADADSTLVVVARFLALLELFRDTVVALHQEEALGEIVVRWTGPDAGTVQVSDEFDEDDDPEEAT